MIPFPLQKVLRNKLRDDRPETRAVTCVARVARSKRSTCARARAGTPMNAFDEIPNPCATCATHVTARVCGHITRNASRNTRNTSSLTPSRKKSVVVVGSWRCAEGQQACLAARSRTFEPAGAPVDAGRAWQLVRLALGLDAPRVRSADCQRALGVQVRHSRLLISPVQTIDTPQMFTTRRVNSAVIRAIETKLPVIFKRELAFALSRFGK